MKKSNLVGALCGAVIMLATSLAHAVTIPLESRLGGLAYYDPNLDVTWAANADINSFATWDNQMTWVAGFKLGGVSGWRLPSADVNGDGTVVNCSSGGVAGCADNEMGFLFWEEGITATAPGVFTNVQPNSYWSSTESAFAGQLVNAWRISFGTGFQNASSKTTERWAWAVHSGDVGAVPVPAAVWLFGSGLLGLIGIARRKKAA